MYVMSPFSSIHYKPDMIMRKFDYFVLGFIVWLMTGCGGSNSSVNPEPEPPITETNANANDR